MHIFNYTNIHDYLDYRADKIKVEDIGPLIYKEHTTKVNVVHNDNYTVTFRVSVVTRVTPFLMSGWVKKNNIQQLTE